MRGKTARDLRKLVGFNIRERRKKKLYLQEEVLGERMGTVVQITQTGTVQYVEKMVPIKRYVADEFRRMYKTLKKGYTKFHESELAKEIKNDLAQMRK